MNQNEPGKEFRGGFLAPGGRKACALGLKGASFAGSG